MQYAIDRCGPGVMTDALTNNGRQKMKRGTILGFRGSWSSGIAALIIKNEKEKVIEIPCENTATARALDACYGGVIQAGRTVSEKPFMGKKIFYEYDDMGLILGRFTPACDFCGNDPAVDVVEGQYVCMGCLDVK
jgi:hypothetical protein